jgi:acetyl esterase/lipase
MQGHKSMLRPLQTARAALLLMTAWFGCAGAQSSKPTAASSANASAAQSATRLANGAPAALTPNATAQSTSNVAAQAPIATSAGASVAASCVLPDPIDDTELVAENDLPYGALTRQSFDFARPRAAVEKRGIVVIVHGGGWTSGTKRLFRKTLALLAGQGYAAGAMNYRLAASPALAFPIQAEDVRCGLHAIVNRAVANGHAPRVVLIGASAGGHLAMLAASPVATQLFDQPSCANAAQFTIGGVISYYAPLRLDSARARYIPIMNQAVDELLRAPDEATWRARVATATIDRYLLNGYPPALLVHGEQDNIVPAEDSRWTADKLAILGSDASLVTLPDGRHGFAVLGAQPAVRPATCAAWAFVRTHANE